MKTGDERRILFVVNQPGNARVLTQAVTEIGVSAMTAASEAELRTTLEGETPDAALVDVSGFGHGAWGLCDLLHARGIPFIVLSPGTVDRADARLLQSGAASVLHKPVAKDALLALLENLDGDEPD